MSKRIITCIVLITVILHSSIPFARAQEPEVTIVDWSWARINSSVVVDANVRNGTGGSAYIGFAAIGYNANGEAVEVGYSGNDIKSHRGTVLLKSHRGTVLLS